MSHPPLRLLYLASFPPLPAVHGAAIRMWNLLQRAAGRFEITFVSFDQPLLLGTHEETQAAAACLSEFCARVVIVPRDTVQRDDPSVSWMPHTCRNAFSPRMAESVRAAAASGFDLVHIDFFEMAQYGALIPGAPLILTEQDASNVALARSFLRSRSVASKREQAHDWQRAMRYFYTFFPTASRVIALTAPDGRRLQRLLPSVPVEQAPTGVDLERFTFQASRSSDERVVFVGHYYHYPNEEAILRFHRQIWPLILRRCPQAKLDVVGSCPTPPVLALEGSRVTVTGTVADVRPYLRDGSVFIAPLRLGEGIKGKLLEAFAAGIPVVATPRVARAIGAVPDQHLLAAERPDAFARQVVRLLRDRALAQRLARQARAFVEAHYGWDRLAARWVEILESVARRPHPGHRVQKARISRQSPQHVDEPREQEWRPRAGAPRAGS